MRRSRRLLAARSSRPGIPYHARREDHQHGGKTRQVRRSVPADRELEGLSGDSSRGTSNEHCDNKEHARHAVIALFAASFGFRIPGPQQGEPDEFGVAVTQYSGSQLPRARHGHERRFHEHVLDHMLTQNLRRQQKCQCAVEVFLVEIAVGPAVAPGQHQGHEYDQRPCDDARHGGSAHQVTGGKRRYEPSISDRPLRLRRA